VDRAAWAAGCTETAVNGSTKEDEGGDRFPALFVF
jgi:hypothetical protein